MKILSFNFKKLCFLFMVISLTYSCSDDANTNTDEDVVLTQGELQAVLETDEITGGVDIALFDLYSNMTATGKSTSNECYSAVYSDTGFTATFNNCVLNGTANVNGTLTVTYDQQGEEGSFTATYVDFYVGTIKINGTRAYSFSANSNESSVTFEVISNITVDMEDGSTISENGTKSFTLAFGESTTYSIDGSWTVVYEGNTYNVTVNSVLSSNVNCDYIATGDMDVSKNGLFVNVDFGDGTCDALASLTYPNGVVEEITLRD